MSGSVRLGALISSVVLLAGCGSSPATPTSAAPPSGSASSAMPTTLVVSVAAWRLPFAIAREAVIPAGAGTVIVGGGMLPDNSSSARAYSLDLSTGQASMLPSLGVDVHDVAGGLYAGEPAIYGGGNATEQSIVQQLHAGAWRVVDHMPTTRSDLSVATVGSTTYVLGGYDGRAVPTEILAQSAGGKLQPAGNLVHGVRYAASAVLGSSVYLFGGEVAGAEMSVVQRYDTLTHQTAVVGHLPVSLGHASAVTLGNRILVLGGRINPNKGTNAMWWFDPTTASFTRAGDLPAPVTDAAVAVAADGLHAWVLGGESPSVRDGVIELALR